MESSGGSEATQSSNQPGESGGVDADPQVVLSRLSPGEAVQLRSRHGAIPALVDADETVSPGVVSMTQCFGDTPDRDASFREIGSPTSRLVAYDDRVDAHTRMPVMSAVPIAVEPLPPGLE